MDKLEIKIPPVDCCGCSACASICPKNAISMQINQEGFLYPIVDSNFCIHCNMCANVCPVIHVCEKNETDESSAYAAYIKDENVQKSSSSGGVFFGLAKAILSDNGIVFGAAFDKKDVSRCIITCVDNLHDLSSLQGCKYVQAEVGSAYKEVKAFLKKGKKVLFSGTPCQIAGLYSYLGQKNDENLFTIDIVCHGVPSPLVYQKYLKFVEKKNNLKKITSIRFRDKVTGWRKYSISVFFDDDSSCSSFAKENLYFRAFLSDICTRKGCSHCKYSKIPRIADISLGDFWGVEHIHPQINDGNGVSLVSINNKHGQMLWDKVTDDLIYKETVLKKAIVYNPRFFSPGKENSKWKDFFENIDKMQFDLLIEKFCPQEGFLKKVVKKVHRVIDHYRSCL